MRQARCRRWGLVVVGSFFLLFVLRTPSEGATQSTSGKKGVSTTQGDKAIKTSPPLARTIKKARTKSAARQTTLKTPTSERQSRHGKTVTRSVRRNRVASRPDKRFRGYATKSPFAPSSSSFSDASPPLPPPRTFAAALLSDARTGEVLFSLNDHREWPAASLTKMMVALLTLEALDRGEVSLRAPVEISRRASSAGGRAINLRPGEVFPLEELLQAMMVTSANDAAVALAEYLKGSVEACVAAMNQRAQQLGMHDTVYQTPNGLPLNDGTPPDISTAADLAILARTLAKHPLLLQWTSLNRIPFRAGRTSLPNTNHLVGRVPGVDGLKTGFTAKARFNLVTTAQRGPLRLIAIVLGGQSSNLRFHTAANLLEWGFTHFTRLNVTGRGNSLGTLDQPIQGNVSIIQQVVAKKELFFLWRHHIESGQQLFQTPLITTAPVAREKTFNWMAEQKNHGTAVAIPPVSPEKIP